MSSDRPVNPLDNKRKAQEEDYFRRQNAELEARLKAKLELEKAGISDEKLREELLAAGFSADSARALFLVPLLEVAWADSKLEPEEAKEVRRFVEERGIEPGSQAHALVDLWLSQKPVDSQFVQAARLLGPYLNQLKKEQPALKDWVLTSSQRVAEATGGLFGFGLNMVSKEEQRVLDKIAERLS